MLVSKNKTGVIMEINEKIHIEEHNPEWFKQYEDEKTTFQGYW